MKVFFTILHDGMFRFFDNAIRHLAQDGHAVTLSIVKIEKEGIRTDAALAACMADVEMTVYPEILRRRGLWRHLLAFSRGIVGYHFASQPAHPWAAISNTKRIYASIPYPWRFWVRKVGLIRRLVLTERFLRWMQFIERSAPPSQPILRLLENEQPAVVVAAPFIYLDSVELEYVKAAQALGIPTAVGVTSWDHLTTKDTFHLMPDLILVWNKWLYEDALKLHHVPEDCLFIAGAPVYDSWFDLKPSQDRVTFCNMLGLDPTRPYLTYLCSSTTISADENVFVEELLAELGRDEVTRDIQLVIRPHPLNAKIWRNFVAPNAAVYPTQGTIPEVNEARQQYFDTLYHGIGAFGINTTGFLDAAVVGKPCLTLLTDRYEETQIKRGHFHYLLDGNFIEVAHSFAELLTLLKALQAGQDPRAALRRQFLQDFLRPHGLELPASEVFADAVVLLAQGHSAAHIREQRPWLNS